VTTDKYAWTLVAAEGAPDGWFFDRLGALVAELVPGATDARVTVQDPDAILNATVPLGGEDRPVDAVLEVAVDIECPPFDPFLAALADQCAHVQGWRVKPTVIFDATLPLERGQQSAAPNVMVFVQRLDGTTPAHFDANWFKHAGHADGVEAESNESRAEREREEAERGGLYRQNRVLEPVTPTAWVVHGFTQLQLGFLVPEVPAEPYERTRGEEAFDRWPPRMVQGSEHRIL
jgi:hypothetical protein